PVRRGAGNEAKFSKFPGEIGRIAKSCAPQRGLVVVLRPMRRFPVGAIDVGPRRKVVKKHACPICHEKLHIATAGNPPGSQWGGDRGSTQDRLREKRSLSYLSGISHPKVHASQAHPTVIRGDGRSSRPLRAGRARTSNSTATRRPAAAR